MYSVPESFSLHWLDYVIFSAMLLVSTGIGVFFAVSGGRQRTTKEYLTGNRQLAMIPASLSIVVSYMSAISMLGDPAESYMYGAIYLWQIVAGGIGAILASILFVPVFYPLQLTSVNKYFEMRFNSPYPKHLGAVTRILLALTYTGIVIYAPSTAIAIIMGAPVWLVVIICATVAILYTTVGGLKAVIWTDVFQSVCMLIGITTILVTAIVHAGGFASTVSHIKDGGRFNFLILSIDPTTRLTIWNTLIASPLNYALVYGTTQPAVIRYSGMKDLSTAKKSVFFVLAGNTVIYQIPILAGLALFAYYSSQRCDPITGGILDNPNQLVTYFLMETLAYPGVPGMFIASLCAGALSSVSSVLNAASANTWDDLLKPQLPNIAEWKATAICKLFVVIYGVCAVSISFFTMNLGGTVLQASLSLAGAIGVPGFGMTLFGCLCPWINSKGALAGGLSSFVLVFWLALGSYSVKKFQTDIIPMSNEGCGISNMTSDMWYNTTWEATTSQNATSLSGMEQAPIGSLSWLYGISFMWYTVIGLTVFFVMASLVSLCTGCTSNYVIDSKLLFPCVRNRYKRYLRKHNRPVSQSQNIQEKDVGIALMDQDS